MIPFSSTDRPEYISKLTRKRLDILVIGGGITGAGILLDAVNRGFDSALLEKKDFASGTSSRSTKLIHGGLRYLKQLQFRLVQETGVERAIVYNNARHLVEKCKMVLPFYKGGSLGPMSTSLALYFYDRLAKVPKAEHKMILKKSTAKRIEPLLNDDQLKGAGLYYEYKVDDTRLTLEIIKKSVENGGTALNYMQVIDFVYENDKIAGVRAKDLLTDETHEILADFVVNATGPWTDTVAQREKAQRGVKKVILSKGIHIVLPKASLPIKQPVYFESIVDKRMIFAIPHGGYTYIGTTDTPYDGNPDKPQATRQEVQYLIQSIQAVFPAVQISEETISSTWAGLRPLIYKPGKAFKELSRQDEVFISPSGLITIAGGKLTGYRKMAERVVETIIQEFKKHEHKSHPVLHLEALTDLSNVAGAEFRGEEEYNRLLAYCISLTSHLKVEESLLYDLFHRYGKNTEQVIALAEKYTESVLDPQLRLDIGGLVYGIRQEMVCTIGDYLIRRTGRLYFGREKILNHLDVLLDILASELQLSVEKLDQMREEFMEEYESVMAWKKESL
jgi:glycerol-3-phosphate dehydrogenase